MFGRVIEMFGRVIEIKGIEYCYRMKNFQKHMKLAGSLATEF